MFSVIVSPHGRSIRDMDTGSRFFKIRYYERVIYDCTKGTFVENNVSEQTLFGWKYRSMKYRMHEKNTGEIQLEETELSKFCCTLL